MREIATVGALEAFLLDLPEETPVFVDLSGAVRFDVEVPRRLLAVKTSDGVWFTADREVPDA